MNERQIELLTKAVDHLRDIRATLNVIAVGIVFIIILFFSR